MANPYKNVVFDSNVEKMMREALLGSEKDLEPEPMQTVITLKRVGKQMVVGSANYGYHEGTVIGVIPNRYSTTIELEDSWDDETVEINIKSMWTLERSQHGCGCAVLFSVGLTSEDCDLDDIDLTDKVNVKYLVEREIIDIRRKFVHSSYGLLVASDTVLNACYNTNDEINPNTPLRVNSVIPTLWKDLMVRYRLGLIREKPYLNSTIFHNGNTEKPCRHYRLGFAKPR